MWGRGRRRGGHGGFGGGWVRAEILFITFGMESNHVELIPK
jgi:hypothetical protein